MSRQFALLLAVVAFTPVGLLADESKLAGSARPLELFEQRIMPIFKSPQPASCVQCHLSAVDLKNYILPSQEKTFASLRDQGLIDLEAPEKSKILTLIRMGERDTDAKARLLHEETRRKEYEAFAAWITACCNDPKLRALPPLSASELARPDRPDEVIRHARKSRVVDSFVRNIWSQRMRCFPCHTPHEIDPSNPQHKIAVERHRNLVANFGDRMHIFRETPEATLQALIEKSKNTEPGHLPLLNLEHPDKSLLVLKPTAKVPEKKQDGTFVDPSYVEPVSHMGGLKMHVDDPSYKSFVAWLGDYAQVVGNRYTSVADLPADNWQPTEHVLQLQDVPDSWPESVRVQLFVHRWDLERKAWDAEPVAFTQNSLTPRRFVGGPLFVFRQATSEGYGDDRSPEKPLAFPSLPPGRYLVKVFVDHDGQLSVDPTVLLGQKDFHGQVEIDARWGKGYPQAQRVSGSALKGELEVTR